MATKSNQYAKEFCALFPNIPLEILSIDDVMLGYQKIYTPYRGYLIVPKSDRNAYHARRITECSPHSLASRHAFFLEEDADQHSFYQLINPKK